MKNNNFHILLSVTLAFVLIAGSVSPAFAQDSKGTPPTYGDLVSTNVAPDHVEIPDAGSLPATAQIPGGAGPLNSIAGSLSSTDQEDVYEICISDHNAFSAAVAQAGFDSQLFLLTQNGLAVYSNDDFLFFFSPSFLPSGDPNGPAANGIYYLAISPFNNEPVNADGELFVDLFGTQAEATAFNPPNLAEGGASPITGWLDGAQAGESGTYNIDLTGVASTSQDCTPVGGEFLSVDTAALVLAGAQTNAVWIMSALAVIGSVAFGALYITTKRN